MIKHRSRSLAALIQTHRELAYVLAGALAVIAFAYLTPPQIDMQSISRLPLLGRLSGDLPGYALRFLASFIFFGLMPLAVALSFGQTPRAFGMVWPAPTLPGWLQAAFMLIVLIVGWVGAYQPQLYAYYPYSRTLMERAAGGSFGWFFLHALLYLVLYYLPWELFFRGFLLFPFVRLVGRGSGRGRAAQPAALLAVACLQAIPSALLHFGHPLSETLASLPFGVWLGWVALRTGSILPGLVLHATAGITQDLWIILRHMGVLP